MHHQYCPAALSCRDDRRPVGAHQGVLAAVVAAALCAWVVLVQHGNPELDAGIPAQSLAVVDGLLGADSHR